MNSFERVFVDNMVGRQYFSDTIFDGADACRLTGGGVITMRFPTCLQAIAHIRRQQIDRSSHVEVIRENDFERAMDRRCTVSMCLDQLF
jgi:hypothetical protein